MAEQDGFVQILVYGGFIHDVTVEAWGLIQSELQIEGVYDVEFEDKYGAPCWLPRRSYMGARHWTPAAGELWREAHGEDTE